MVYFKRACFCCQLSTAGVILGWLGAIGYFIKVVFGLIIVTSQDLVDNKLYNGADGYYFMLGINITIGLFISISAINLIAAICLMIGSMKANRLLLLPWLYGEMVVICITGIAVLVVLGELFTEFTPQSVFSSIFAILYFAIQLYFWLCIYSLYQQIRNADNSGQQDLQLATKRKTNIPKDGLPPYSSLA